MTTSEILGKTTILWLRIIGAGACVVFGGFILLSSSASFSGVSSILSGTALIVFGLVLLILGSHRVWLTHVLLAVAVLLFVSKDIHEIAVGQEHWARPIPLIVLYLISVFGKRRTDC